VRDLEAACQLHDGYRRMYGPLAHRARQAPPAELPGMDRLREYSGTPIDPTTRRSCSGSVWGDTPRLSGGPPKGTVAVLLNGELRYADPRWQGGQEGGTSADRARTEASHAQIPVEVPLRS
jgi:hypothetical protein